MVPDADDHTDTALAREVADSMHTAYAGLNDMVANLAMASGLTDDLYRSRVAGFRGRLTEYVPIEQLATYAEMEKFSGPHNEEGKTA